METFLNANPGLKSRINLYFNFPDYTPDELFDIANYYAKQKKSKTYKRNKTNFKETTQ